MTRFISGQSTSTSSVIDVDSRSALSESSADSEAVKRPTWLAQALTTTRNGEILHSSKDHSAYGDQWGWERVITTEQLNPVFLKSIIG